MQILRFFDPRHGKMNQFLYAVFVFALFIIADRYGYIISSTITSSGYYLLYLYCITLATSKRLRDINVYDTSIHLAATIIIFFGCISLAGFSNLGSIIGTYALVMGITAWFITVPLLLLFGATFIYLIGKSSYEENIEEMPDLYEGQIKEAEKRFTKGDKQNDQHN